MRHLRLLCVLAILFASSWTTSAALALPVSYAGTQLRLVDFNDLPRGGRYCSGCPRTLEYPAQRPDLIVSGGMRIILDTLSQPAVPENEPLEGWVNVAADPSGGNALEVIEGSLNPEFDTFPVSYVSIEIAQLAEYFQLIINGDLIDADFLSELDGQSVRGVTIDVLPPASGDSFSLLVLSGNIENLQFGGSRFLADNLHYGQSEVPEPATCFLLGAGVLGGLCRSRTGRTLARRCRKPCIRKASRVRWGM